GCSSSRSCASSAFSSSCWLIPRLFVGGFQRLSGEQLVGGNRGFDDSARLKDATPKRSISAVLNLPKFRDFFLAVSPTLNLHSIKSIFYRNVFGTWLALTLMYRRCELQPNFLELENRWLQALQAS